jgi:hypothetical protein
VSGVVETKATTIQYSLILLGPWMTDDEAQSYLMLKDLSDAKVVYFYYAL